MGGILASLMQDEIWDVTGIKPIAGVLSDPGAFRMLDEKDNNLLVVDDMIPDYDLFDDVNHKYSLIKDSFFGYSTRGCPNRCEFCGVHKLEPKFKDYNGIKPPSFHRPTCYRHLLPEMHSKVAWDKEGKSAE
jgi:radical SAM superfamily enzyme YgiQ (UPF0313 family)